MKDTDTRQSVPRRRSRQSRSRTPTTPDSLARPARRRRDARPVSRHDVCCSRPAAAATSSGSSGSSIRDRHDLRLGIAEADVELDHLGTVRGQHESDVKESAERIPSAAIPRNHRVDDLAHHPIVKRGIDERARRERSHAAGVRTTIVVEDSLVILRRTDRKCPAAVATTKNETSGPLRHSSITSRSAGVAESALGHRLATPRPRLLRGRRQSLRPCRPRAHPP